MLDLCIYINFLVAVVEPVILFGRFQMGTLYLILLAVCLRLLLKLQMI